MEHRAVAFNRIAIEAALSEIPLGGLRFFRSITSTNDLALQWAAEGAADMSLVVADEQTAGRGRAGRTWSTPPGTALALSLIVRGLTESAGMPGRLAGFAAVSVADACETLGLMPRIKWPNDVLVNDRKVAGVLVESEWSGNALEASVVGIGINVRAESVPPASRLRYPATSLEDGLASAPERLAVLRLVAGALSQWRGRLSEDALIEAWESRLAFRGKRVIVKQDGVSPIEGVLEGIDADGRLRLTTYSGVQHLPIGELHLDGADDTIA